MGPPAKRHQGTEAVGTDGTAAGAASSPASQPSEFSASEHTVCFGRQRSRRQRSDCDDFVNLEDLPAQSLGDAHRDNLRACIYKNKYVCVFMSVCVYTVFLKKPRVRSCKMTESSSSCEHQHKGVELGRMIKLLN